MTQKLSVSILMTAMTMLCSYNVLVGPDDTAKLANFGFSAIKALSADAVEPISPEHRYAILSSSGSLFCASSRTLGHNAGLLSTCLKIPK